MNADTKFEEAGFTCEFGTAVRATKIAVYIVIRFENTRASFGVYLSHGVAGGAFWRNSSPLTTCHTIDEARAVAETLYGVAGSGQLANLVSY